MAIFCKTESTFDILFMQINSYSKMLGRSAFHAGGHFSEVARPVEKAGVQVISAH